jgi:hypothetical protein
MVGRLVLELQAGCSCKGYKISFLFFFFVFFLLNLKIVHTRFDFFLELYCKIALHKREMKWKQKWNGERQTWFSAHVIFLLLVYEKTIFV